MLHLLVPRAIVIHTDWDFTFLTGVFFGSFHFINCLRGRIS